MESIIVGSLYDAKEPMVAMVKPDGEWNTMEVTCKGPLIKVVLNGKPVIDLNIDDWKEPRKNPDGSKNKFKTALKDCRKPVILGSSIMGNPSGSEISRLLLCIKGMRSPVFLILILSLFTGCQESSFQSLKKTDELFVYEGLPHLVRENLSLIHI